MRDPVYITAEGLEKLKEELVDLTGPQRTELAQRLNFAISQGDLKENAMYIKAKEDQGFLEGRIQEIEYILRHYELIDENIVSDQVRIGSTVTVQEVGESDTETYKIVGTKEASPLDGRISNESPIGTAILNAKINDIIEVKSPSGGIKFKVVKIE